MCGIAGVFYFNNNSNIIISSNINSHNIIIIIHNISRVGVEVVHEYVWVVFSVDVVICCGVLDVA